MRARFYVAGAALAALVAIACNAAPSSPPVGVAGPVYVPSFTTGSTNEPAIAGEAVAVDGGADADWTPSGLDAGLAITRALWVGGAGTVKVDLVNAGTVSLVGVPAGTKIDVCVTKIYSLADGTTATNIVALY